MLYDSHLDIFLKVAEAGSFSKAANDLFITPSAVIKQINLFEKNLGVTLFVRGKRHLHRLSQVLLQRLVGSAQAVSEAEQIRSLPRIREFQISALRAYSD